MCEAVKPIGTIKECTYDEMALKIADRYITVHENEKFFSYSLFDENFSLLCTGIYDQPDSILLDVLNFVFSNIKKYPHFSGNISRSSALELIEWNEMVRCVQMESDKCLSESGMPSNQELLRYSMEYVQNIMDSLNSEDASLQLRIKGCAIYNGICPCSEKTVNVLLEYTGDFKDYELFNIIHDESTTLRNIVVDINPIRTEKEGNLFDYLSHYEQ